MRHVSLAHMEQGQSGRMVGIQAGMGLTNRLDTMGLRIGKHIVKVSHLFWRGPVTVNVGTTQMSLGFGMAAKVIVEVEGP